MCLNIIPELHKGMLKGVIYALGVQSKGVYVHILCHWIIFPTNIYMFAFKMNYGIVGIWCAKVFLECCLYVCYTIIIEISDWDQIAKEA